SVEKQKIELVGHSRGAEVNSLIARELHSQGYRVEQFVSLDGYGTDWPGGAASLGSVNIVDELAGIPINRKLNYRVERSLFDAFTGDNAALTSVGVTLAAVLLGIVDNVDDVIDLATGILDARAPARAGFENEIIYSPDGPSVKSSHVNIVDIFSKSGD